ncbi:MAG TPA: DsbA family protein [Dehalococcoidia bacterium]|nr:DsbA family protein [Dehalococcoidia bacterium]
MTTETQEAQPATTFPVVIFGDFVCPYSYLAVEQVQRLAQEYDVQPLWRPHWLHPETPPEGQPYATGANPERRQATIQWIKEMAPETAERMRFPDRRQFSFFAFEALEYAQDCGLALPFAAAVYDALWVRGEDIGRVATLQGAADRVGLDAEELARALLDPDYMNRTLEAVETARRIGITSTPTFIIGRTRMNGWSYYEVLQSIIEKQGKLPCAPSTPSDGITAPPSE